MTLVTEKEAAEKWCPLARSWSYAGDDTSVSINRTDIGMSDDACLCIGSKCMAWRWKEQPGPRHPDAPERDDRGYCGAFGKVGP